MYRLIGVLKKEETQEYVCKDGTPGKKRILFVEPEGSIYPVKVSVSDMDLKAGKIGEKVTLDVEIYPFYIQNKTRQKAFMDIYIPNKK